MIIETAVSDANEADLSKFVCNGLDDDDGSVPLAVEFKLCLLPAIM